MLDTSRMSADGKRRAVPRRGAGTVRTLLAVIGLVTCFAPSLLAQAADHGEVVAAGERYRAGPLHRWILGRHYRDVWSQIIQVELLDLSSFAGGLEPLRTGGGLQTRSLRFMGADGREYSFRSVDKDPSAVLDPLLRGTVVNELVQDGISAAHPYGALVAAPLLEAAGVLHVEPQLRLMPDDPALGEFREEFAGVLGLIEERPDENQGDRTSFAGTARVIASETLTERLDRGPGDLVDSGAFLTARLVDVFLGDWDRHRGQWRWATYSEAEPRTWLPVPTDRDQAFSKFDGAATRIVSLYMPQFVRFEESYPNITRLHWNARALDRWFLSGLERQVWDSVGTALQARLTDEVIEEAVRQLPPEIHALGGEELARTLRVRRDLLNEAWDEFYRLLADKVDIHATNADEVVVVDRSESGRVGVTITAPDHLEAAYFQRRFDATETDEIRIYLGGGDDQVVVRGGAWSNITIRIIGGAGDDRYEFGSDGQRVRLYDHEGVNQVSGSGSQPIDDKEFDEWVWTEEDRDQPRDWGSSTLPIFWSLYSSDLGLFLGGGAHFERYGFRKPPYASAFDVRGGYTPTLRKGRVEIEGRLNQENSRLFWTLGGRISRLDVLHYFGLGNTTPTGAQSFHKVDQTAASFALGLGVSPSSRFVLSGGLALERFSTGENTGRFYNTLDSIYGNGQFIQLGATASLVLDPFIDSETTGNRIRVSLIGTAFPDLLDVERTFGRAGAEVSTLLAPSLDPWISLALRAGGEQVWGRFPWYEAAFLGGNSTIRGWADQRFAGDAAAFASAELRLRFWRPQVLVPVGTGVFGFADAGRVSLAGSSPGGWHTSLGGGLWFQPVRQPYIVRAGIGVSDESTKFFVILGLPY